MLVKFPVAKSPPCRCSRDGRASDTVPTSPVAAAAPDDVSTVAAPNRIRNLILPPSSGVSAPKPAYCPSGPAHSSLLVIVGRSAVVPSKVLASLSQPPVPGHTERRHSTGAGGADQNRRSVRLRFGLRRGK